MNRQSQWLFEAPFSLQEADYMVRSALAKKSRFTRQQIRQEILDTQKTAAERQPPSTTIRTERSEKARHRDTTKGIHGHHAFPKYLGGLKQQALAYIPADLHYLYHQEVDKIVQLPRSGKGYRKLIRSERQAILNKLQAHAKDFDQRYPTNVLPLMQTAIRAAKSRGLI
jgi:hypothetical protein